MAIPEYQSYMKPVMEIAADKKEHTVREVYDEMEKLFKLTDKDLKELLPSGKQTYFTNRIGWALTYLKKAKLLESTGRGKFKITERGLNVIKNKPAEINKKFLLQFPEFQECLYQTKQKAVMEKSDLIQEEQTPEEILEASYQGLRDELAQELLKKIMECSPQFFERLVVDLLVAMGYGGSRKDAGEAVGQSGDEGIDGIIKEDKLGLDAVYIQAKRWNNNVGRPIVQAFAGALMGKKANKGVLITTSQFSKDAIEYVAKIDKKIVLISGELLAQLMIDHGVGVTDVNIYVIKKIDTDYFEE
ncbi:restriction endonuclease [Candidatus Parcubacteria bacterium]|nr:MAG: restriction endonuclease [Candidatus Parcubacteria bacterium]